MKKLISSIIGILSILGPPIYAEETPESPAKVRASSSDLTTPPEGLSDADWSGIQTAYESNRHAISSNADGSHQARNPGQAWITRFDGRGFTVIPDAGGWEWGLELEGFGKVTKVLNEGGNLSYLRRGGLTEWFINDQRGLEQGWTFSERPANAEEDAPLQLRLAVRGGLKPQVSTSGASVAFLNPSGNSALSYGGLKAWDADGKTLQVRFVGNDEDIRNIIVEVNDDGARYPLTVDPIAQQTDYLKASNANGSDRFGDSIAISGNTVVVGAPYESSNATGVNGDDADNSRSRAGAAYVFVRNGSTWTQDAYLKASNTGSSHQFGKAVTISGDTIVVGAPHENSNATGVNGDEANSSTPQAGSAYVFVRNGTTWSQKAYLKASNTYRGDQFGWSVSVSDDSIVVGAYSENSNSTGVNGDQTNNIGENSTGAAYVFVWGGTTWSQEAYLKASNTNREDLFGRSVAISGDTIVVGAYAEDSNATGINGDEANNSAAEAGAAYVFVRNGTTWSQEAYLKASNTNREDFFGRSVAVSGDTIVIGAPDEDGSTERSGAVYVFKRNGTTWSQEAYLKASNIGYGDAFGRSVAVSGNTIVVGANTEAGLAGAAYVFARNGTTWSQEAYLKASNTETRDFFGQSVAVSGYTIVVGAYGDDSNATDINGDETDNSAAEAGAAWAFVFDEPEISSLTTTATDGLIDGSGDYLPGETATLTATPDPGFLFDGWNGDASGSDNPLNLVMDSDKTVGAIFIQDTSDTDSDGLSAYEEIVLHGTDPTLADTDGDGFDDLFEINTGFDPTLNTSTPEALSEILTAVEFRFNATNGVSYLIESSTNLVNWNVVETGIMGAGERVTRFYSIEGLPKRHFRARRE